MPGDGKRVSWHQDASYWPLSPSKAVTAWLAIDDATVENACMRYIPGTHRLGHLTYTLTEDDDTAVLNQTVDGADQFGEPVDVELAAGEISLHSDLLLHGSEANQSARRRCGLTLRYCPAGVRADLGWNAKGVIVSGQTRTPPGTGRIRPVPWPTDPLAALTGKTLGPNDPGAFPHHHQAIRRDVLQFLQAAVRPADIERHRCGAAQPEVEPAIVHR